MLVLISLGGAVRATDSGLACPDWPLCYGKVVPRQEDIPDGSGYTLWNVWLEHTHRLVASVVSVLIVVLAVWVLRSRRSTRVHVPILGALVAVLAQGVLGALVVLHLLHGELVTAHLGMSMVVVACLVVAAIRMGAGGGGSAAVLDVRQRRGAVVVAGLVFVQLLVGSQVTGQHASLAYGRDPLRFHGRLIPTTVTTVPEAYHLAHRLLAYTAAAAVLITTARMWRRRCDRRPWSPDSPMRASALLAVVLTVLVLTQIGLGFANIWLLTPPELVTAHLTVASWIWAAAVALVAIAYTPAESR